jgi:iron complex outermembrane receptor protein
LAIVLQLDNLTSELYSEHLSYLRDPFAAGAKVFAPGRTLRVALSYRTGGVEN